LGHFGLTATTFLTEAPREQVIVFLLFAAITAFVGVGVGDGVCVAVAAGVGVGVGVGLLSTFSWLSLARTSGAENPNPLADMVSHPSFSLITVVATFVVPSAPNTSRVALIGASVKP
jgi:hypothetical protein